MYGSYLSGPKHITISANNDDDDDDKLVVFSYIVFVKEVFQHRSIGMDIPRNYLGTSM